MSRTTRSQRVIKLSIVARILSQALDVDLGEEEVLQLAEEVERPDPRFMTVEEAAEALDISTVYARPVCQAGGVGTRRRKFYVVIERSKVVYCRADVERLAEERREQGLQGLEEVA